jgi:broad specificity phosphatase PhoE
MARTKPPTPPSTGTLVLLVRHGQTPTTGKLLPGRAPGLHLADAGHEQARAPPSASPRSRVDAIYASPLERARETAAPIAAARNLKVKIDKGLLECDFGEWTGAELKKLMKLPEWQHGAARAVVVPLPRRRELHRDADPHRRCARPAARRAPRRRDRVRLARRPDQGGRRPRDGHPHRPVPAHRHQHLLDQRDRVRPTGSPIVLTVNSTGGSLAELRRRDPERPRAMSVFYDFDEVDVFTVGALGVPGQRTFVLQARRGKPNGSR